MRSLGKLGMTEIFRPRREAGEGLRENWFARQIARTEGAIGISEEMPAIEILTSLALLRMTTLAGIPSTIPKQGTEPARFRLSAVEKTAILFIYENFLQKGEIPL